MKFKRMAGKTPCSLLIAALVLSAAACAQKTDCMGNRDYYLENSGKQHEVMNDLFDLLAKAERDDERFSLVREIANQYSRLNDNYRLIHFLDDWIEEHPNDPYNSYYLLKIADCYIREDSSPIAALYFNIIVKNYPDLIVRGESIHLACFKQLIILVEDPVQRTWYYEQIIARFPEKIDLGTAYFMEGQNYEQIGKWKEAIAAYNNFIPYYGTIIAGFPDAYYYAKQMVDFNNTLKNYGGAAKFDRTFESLPMLISTIRSALDDGDTYRLWRYRARVNFFARSWSQIGADDEVSDFNLSSFSASGKIRYADDLSTGSGANEAYFKTWGWSKFTPIWYFYFRKIYFPMDPSINGRWEWSGVYYGERF